MPRIDDPTTAEAEPVRRRWIGLTGDQRATAAELARRAERLRAESEDGISVTEAVRLAAIQLGFEP
jgi:hypothetical protein